MLRAPPLRYSPTPPLLNSALSRHRLSHQIGQSLGPHLAADLGPAGLDRAHAPAQGVGDFLVRHAVDQHLQDLSLVGRETVEPATEGLMADLRTKPNVANSSITEPKPLDSDGKAALLVADDSLEGTMASLVVVDSSGRVVSKQPTTVGGK